MTKLERKAIRMEAQRDAARMNALELARHARFLLRCIDEGYTVRPSERAEIEKSIRRPPPYRRRRP